MSFSKEFNYFTDRIDQFRFFYQKYSANLAKQIVIVVHGYGEHSGRYQNVINTFAGTNTSLYLMDNRGHGRSEGQRGHVMSFTQYLDDLHEFVRIVETHEPRLPIFFVAHSMGANIVANYLTQRKDDFAGAVLASPGFQIGVDISKTKEWFAKIMSHLFPWASIPSGLDISMLSHDPQVSQMYQNDPLTHDKVSARWFTEYVKFGNLAIRNASYIRCPILVLQGAEDHLIAPEGARTFFQNIEHSDKTMHWLEGFYHEIFHEVEKEKPLYLLKEWILQRSSLLSSANLEQAQPDHLLRAKSKK